MYGNRVDWNCWLDVYLFLSGAEMKNHLAASDSGTEHGSGAIGFTPGPWELRTVDGSIASIDAADGTPIAQAFQVKPLPEDFKQLERKANARLIAAAPELLEALKYARRFLKKDDYDTDYIDSVIAKATGTAVTLNP
jgi:hypothetical protein